MPVRQNRTKVPQVDREKILDSEFENLEPHERRWLQDTDYWPEGATPQPVTFFLPTGEEISNDPTFLLMNGDRNTELLNQLIETRAQQLAAQRQGSVGDTEQVDDLEVPEPGTFTREVDYADMGIQELRGEALSRGMSIDGDKGKKVNLIEALTQWDEDHPEGTQGDEDE